MAGSIASTRRPPRSGSLPRAAGLGEPAQFVLGLSREQVDEAALAKYCVDGIAGAYLDKARPDWFPVKPAY